MQANPIEIQQFLPEHLDAAVELSREAGWPHRKEDWALVLSLSRGFVAIENGVVVGTAMATLFGETCANVNMVIVSSAMRGRGLGRRLMDAALDAAGSRECRLVATADGLPLYEKMGFAVCGEVIQHQGLVGPVEAPTSVDWVDGAMAPELAKLDRVAFGADRSFLFDALGQQARFAVIRKDGAITGFAALRAFGRGEVIGPVVAQEAGAARALIAFILSQRTGAFLRVDTTIDTGLAPWLTEHGLLHVGGGLPMRRGGAVASAPETIRTFALTSQALG